MSREFSRREFLGVGAVVAGASLAGNPIWPIPTASAQTSSAQTSRGAASNRVRFGIIGIGMQGNSLLRESIAFPDVECAAACDVYDGRHVLAREIAGESLPVTRDYRRLLDDQSIDAVIIAVPDHWHRKMVIDAVSAGKDVYIEKPMSHTPADGVAMVEAARRSGRIVQVGSQRVSSRLCAKVKELLSQNVIGDLTLAEAWLGRNSPNGAWVYPPPPDLSPENLDWNAWLGDAPRRPFDPILFARWRAWREYGTGVAGDLLVHLVSGFNFMTGLNQPPAQAMSVGGIRRWKDGRNTPDVQAVQFYYGDLPVSMRLNLGTAMPEGYRFQGTKGILEVMGGTITVSPQTGEDTGPSWYAGSFPRAMREAHQKEWNEKNGLKPGQQAPLTESITIRGPGYDDIKPHLWNFFEAVRSRRPVVEDAVFGHNAALACHMANEAYYRRAVVTAEEMVRGGVGGE